MSTSVNKLCQLTITVTCALELSYVFHVWELLPDTRDMTEKLNNNYKLQNNPRKKQLIQCVL